MNSRESAGGIGGLLGAAQVAMQTPGHTVASGTYTYHYDGNGNVTQVVRHYSVGWQGYWAIVARYEYDAYGNVIGPDTNSNGVFDPNDTPGVYASENAWRFSTKQFDNETGWGYWGRRYYDPKKGRWGSRDPLEERGDLDLYRYARGNPPLPRGCHWVGIDLRVRS